MDSCQHGEVKQAQFATPATDPLDPLAGLTRAGIKRVQIFPRSTVRWQARSEMNPSNPAEQITVSRSTVTGFDNESLPYAMSAQSAIQDKDVPSKVHLQTVSGQSQRANGGIVKMRANTGLYDTDTRYLDLNGEVEITSPGRFTAHMDAARVSVKEKKLVSDTPVVGA